MELAQLEESDLFCPIAEVQDGDHVVGDASEELKRLYTLGMRKQRASEELQLKARYSSSSAEAQLLLAEASECAVKSETVQALFWIALNDEFGLWDKRGTGLRADWKVVWFECRDDSITDIMRRFFQGDS